jgi:hypothetical protein
MEKSEFLGKTSKVLKETLRILGFVCLVALGYILSELYHYSTMERGKADCSSPKVTKTIKEISVAINERSELMIIDRTTGEYEIYQDSIGQSIFNLYATRIQSEYQNP